MHAKGDPRILPTARGNTGSNHGKDGQMSEEDSRPKFVVFREPAKSQVESDSQEVVQKPLSCPRGAAGSRGSLAVLPAM